MFIRLNGIPEPPEGYVPPLGSSRETWTNIYKNKGRIDYCVQQFGVSAQGSAEQCAAGAPRSSCCAVRRCAGFSACPSMLRALAHVAYAYEGIHGIMYGRVLVQGSGLAGLERVAGIAIRRLVRCGRLPRWAPTWLPELQRAPWDS